MVPLLTLHKSLGTEIGQFLCCKVRPPEIISIVPPLTLHKSQDVELGPSFSAAKLNLSETSVHCLCGMNDLHKLP